MDRSRACRAAVLTTLLAACGGSSSTPPPAPNQAPLAQAVDLTLAQDRTVTFTVTGTDADQDPLTYQAASQPAHGTLSGTPPAWTYTPAAGYFGRDRFTFAVSDGKATSPAAEVGLNVLPVRGPVVPGGELLDDLLVGTLHSLGMVGGVSAAVSKDGKLVYARGVGYADAPSQAPFAPDALGRIASISKTVTMSAVMHLIDGGLLGLDDRLLDRLPAYAAVNLLDPRMVDITLRQVLSHTSGLPPNDDADPMFQNVAIAVSLGIPSPPTCEETFRWSLGNRRLWFAPGAGHAYSNLGFCALSLVVEQATGQAYQVYVRDTVLAPMGIHDMRFGASHRADRAPGEVTYASPWSGASVFPGDPPSVPVQYGGFSVPTSAGCGAWIGSTVDLTRFLNGLEGRGQAAFLSVSSLAAATTEQWAGSAYGLGVEFYDAAGTRWWGHIGGLGGARSLAFRSDSGWDFSVLFNSEPAQNTDAAYTQLYNGTFDAIAGTLAAGFTGSPTDLYPSFPSPELGPYTGP
jgi:CubicO group peptidase (beta-lactamase class C family)